MPAFQQSGKLDDKMLCMVTKAYNEGKAMTIAYLQWLLLYIALHEICCVTVCDMSLVVAMNSTEVPQARQLVHQQLCIKYIMDMALRINYRAMECGVGYI